MTNSTFITRLNAPLTVISEGTIGSCEYSHVAVKSREALAQLLGECCQMRACVMTGAPRELPELGHKRQAVFVDLNGFKNIVEHSRPDQVISVETGMTLAELDAILEKNGQWWPVSGPPESTIYDVIVSGDGGPLEHGYGGPRYAVLGLEVALATGSLIHTGGKVVKNVTGYDTSKLMVGSRGTLGLPCLAHLRLFARPQSDATLLCAGKLVDLIAQANAFISSGLPLGILEIIGIDAFGNLEPRIFKALKQACGEPVPHFLLIARVYEHDEVLSEVMPQLHQLVTPGVVPLIPEADLAKELIPAISKIANNYIELSCSPSVISRLARELPFGEEGGLRIRIQSGRMRFIIKHAEDTGHMMHTLLQYCELKKCELTLARRDGERYYVQRFPAQDTEQHDLAQSIKKQFDPTGCLNPYVQL